MAFHHRGWILRRRSLVVNFQDSKIVVAVIDNSRSSPRLTKDKMFCLLLDKSGTHDFLWLETHATTRHRCSPTSVLSFAESCFSCFTSLSRTDSYRQVLDVQLTGFILAFECCSVYGRSVDSSTRDHWCICGTDCLWTRLILLRLDAHHSS